MNILVTLDSNYVTPLCTMLSSLIRSNPRTAFDIYVAYAHLTEADFQRIGKAVDGSGRPAVSSAFAYPIPYLKKHPY